MIRVPQLTLLLLAACSSPDEPQAPEGGWGDLIRTLAPLHERLGEPVAGDWLVTHPEDGQTFEQYRRSSPVRPRGHRKVVYIQPIGPMAPAQARIVKSCAEFMALYFGTDVRMRDPLPLSLVPESAQRASRGYGTQLLTTHVMGGILRPRLPDDAAAYLALTAMDLWPGPGWNFVFGQASLRQRVGVWSIARNGDPGKGEEEFRQCLLRTIKTATHETGHMFSMAHCIAYECNMCGSNSQEESDRRPVALCPQCVAKVCWATGSDPAERYRRLAAKCRELGLRSEASRYDGLGRALKRD